MSDLPKNEPEVDSPPVPDQTLLPGQPLENLFDDNQPPAAANNDSDDDDDDAGGLFGDDDDENEAPQQPPTAPSPMSQSDDGLTPEERERRHRLEYGEDEDGDMELIKKHEAIAQVELANFGMPATEKVWHARLPNFLSLQPMAFDELMWEPEDLEEVLMMENGEEGKPKAPIPDENVIRWRWAIGPDGTPIKESNARTIRWSDGSLSLQVGAELFDISATVDHSAVLSSSATSAPAPLVKTATAGLSVLDTNRGHGLTYLTAEHSYQGLIEAQASVYGTLTFRPTTLQSNTHRRLAGSIAGRYVKGRGIKIAALPDEDPEKKKLEREKEELARAKKLKKKAQVTGGAGRKAARRATRFEDGDDDGEEGETTSRSQPRRQQNTDDEDSDGGFIEHDTDESEVDEPRSKKSSSKKRRPSPEYSDDDDEPDEMDEAEARIENEERRRKERKKEQKQAPEPAQAPRRRLVVESDEE
ncbi:RNA polymerase-associated protein LEO1, partial [Phenoliferia sp. Uapishka_3]